MWKSLAWDLIELLTISVDNSDLGGPQWCDSVKANFKCSTKRTFGERVLGAQNGVMAPTFGLYVTHPPLTPSQSFMECGRASALHTPNLRFCPGISTVQRLGEALESCYWSKQITLSEVDQMFICLAKPVISTTGMMPIQWECVSNMCTAAIILRPPTWLIHRGRS